MAKVVVHGKPDYERFERGVRMMFAELSPELQLKYASRASGVSRNDDLEPVKNENGPQNRI